MAYKLTAAFVHLLKQFRARAMTAITALTAILLLSRSLPAIEPDRLPTQYRQLTWNNQNGLLQSSAQAITQTADGYLWIGTQEGLSRFDGVRFVNFNQKNTPEILNNFVVAELSARDGSLWACTNGGLIHYANGTFHTFTKAEGLISDQTNGIFQANDGSIWIGTDQGISRYSEGRFHNYYAHRDFPAGSAQAFLEDQDHALWVASDTGLVRYKSDSFTRFPLPPDMQAKVNAIAMDRDRSLILATNGSGLIRFSNGVYRPIQTSAFSGKVGRDLLRDRHGSLWVAFYGAGAIRIHGERQSPYTSANGLPNDNLLCAFEDREGNIWLGSEGGGLIELQDAPIVNWGPPEGLPKATVWSVLQDRRGAIWMGVDHGGLNRLDRERIEHFPIPAGLNAKTILALCEDRDGSLWAGTENGGLLHVSSTKTEAIRLPTSLEVRAIVQDRDGSLWIGVFEGGVLHYRDGKFETLTAQQGLFGNGVDCLLLDSAGTLWVGGLGGLSRISGRRIETFLAQKDLHGDSVYSLFEDRDRHLWVGTANGGLHRFADNRITFYGTKQGLYDATVGNIAEDDLGYMWMSCNQGIFRVRKQELEDFAIGKTASIKSQAFTMEDGMRNSECNTGVVPTVWKTIEGKLWFATMGGAAVINPQKVRTIVVPPRVVLEHVTINGADYPAVGGVDIPPGKRNVMFSFTAPSFRNPAEIRFSYRLDGYDTSWIDADTLRTVSYTNLPPGQYRFHVVATVPGGMRTREAAQFGFRLQPHYYQRLWFYLLIAVVAGLLLFGLYRLRVRQIQRYNRELERRIAERTAALQEAMKAAEAAGDAKTSFLANMSHEIRTPLNAVIAMTDLLLDARLGPEERESVEIIRTSGAALLSIVNSILDLAKIESRKIDISREPFDLLECVNEAIEMIRPQANAKRVPILQVMAQDLPTQWIGDACRLRQVLVNLLSNAVKFTDAGHVELRAWTTPAPDGGSLANLNFSIRDTGIGIPASNFSQLFTSFSQVDNSTTRKHGGTGLGLAISRQLVELMGGKISFESTPGKGSIFSFYVRADHVGVIPDLSDAEAGARNDSSGQELLADDVPLKILLVEDNPVNQKVALRLLQRMGYQPDIVVNGVEGVAAVGESLYDVILMDVHMPEMDGLAATRAIRRILGPDRQPRIIGMTANALHGAREACLEAGMDDYLAKPFTLGDLQAALRRCKYDSTDAFERPEQVIPS